MTVTRKGYDPDLGKKFAQGLTGSVIGFSKSSRKKYEPPERDHAPDSQEQQDDEIDRYLQSQCEQAPESVDPTEGMERMARARLQELSTTAGKPG